MIEQLMAKVTYGARLSGPVSNGFVAAQACDSERDVSLEQSRDYMRRMVEENPELERFREVYERSVGLYSVPMADVRSRLDSANARRDCPPNPMRGGALTIWGLNIAQIEDPDSILLRDERLRRARLAGHPDYFEDTWKGERYGHRIS